MYNPTFFIGTLNSTCTRNTSDVIHIKTAVTEISTIYFLLKLIINKKQNKLLHIRWLVIALIIPHESCCLKITIWSNVYGLQRGQS